MLFRSDDLYTALLPGSANRGAIDYPALLAGRPQPPAGRQPSTGQTDGSGYQLYRVGDAVASRNIHAAILDSLRLCAAI